MVKSHVATLSGIFNDIISFFPPGIIMSVAAGCVEHRKYWDKYVKEFVGTVLMIGFTFSAGKWFGKESWMAAWVFHAIGVVAADKIGKEDHGDVLVDEPKPKMTSSSRSFFSLFHQAVVKW
jgi:hypothetical protein